VPYGYKLTFHSCRYFSDDIFGSIITWKTKVCDDINRDVQCTWLSWWCWCSWTDTLSCEHNLEITRSGLIYKDINETGGSMYFWMIGMS